MISRLLGGLAFALCADASAAPLLRCELTYAGATQTLTAQPVSDPYAVPSVGIGGRFRFKAVMAGSAAAVTSINIYAYLETASQPVPIQHARYLPPFAPALTGEQHLYAGPLERELIYRCVLEGVPQ